MHVVDHVNFFKARGQQLSRRIVCQDTGLTWNEDRYAKYLFSFNYHPPELWRPSQLLKSQPIGIRGKLNGEDLQSVDRWRQHHRGERSNMTHKPVEGKDRISALKP